MHMYTIILCVRHSDVINPRRKAWAEGYCNHLVIFCPSVRWVWYGITVRTGPFFTDHFVDSELQPITVAISVATATTVLGMI